VTRPAIYPAVFALLFLVGGCQPKIRQCGRLIEKLNAGGTDAEKALPDGGSDTARMKVILDAIGARRADVAAVQLDDAKLVGMRDDYVAMLGMVESAAKARLAAEEAKDEAKIDAAKKEMSAATEKERVLVTGLNDYCSANK
jgi:hypothetical protein